jgi:haloalkane dehalogenase
VDLVGSDSGGAIAQLFVARYPERVRTLLLTNCDVHQDSPPPAVLPVIAARAGTFADQILPNLSALSWRAKDRGGESVLS